MKLIHLTESVDVALGSSMAGMTPEEMREKALKIVESKGGKVIPVIEAIHSSVTRNCTFYGPSRLKGKADFIHKESGKLRPTGVYSWTNPLSQV